MEASGKGLTVVEVSEVNRHGDCYLLHRRSISMARLVQPMLSQFFWDKKLKIAMLTLATFASLC